MSKSQLTTHPSQTRSNFPARAGAIRRSTNHRTESAAFASVTRAPEADQEYAMGKQKSPSNNCTPSPGKGKHKPPDIDTSPVSLQDQDLFVGSPVHTPKRCWKDELIWDLDGVRNLRDLLILWIDSGVTASNIGCFLKNVLYDRDEHLDGRLTRMVNNHETHTQIALDLLKHYQVRDEAGKPLWELKASQLGNEYSRSGQPSASSTPSTPSEPSEPSSKAGTKSLKITVPLFFRMLSRSPLEPEPTQTSKRNFWYQVPAPKPRRTFKKPYFMNNVEPIREIEEVSDGFSGKACWSFNISEDLTMLTIAERRALMANTGALPPSFAAEIHDTTPVVDISSLYTANHLQMQGLKKEHERTLSGGSRGSYSSSDYGD